MKTIPNQPLLPPQRTAARLGAMGFIVGPAVDSLHNQSLLRYDIAPISVSFSPTSIPSESDHPLFSSSWVVPPLLAFAYIVLGYILPRLIELLPIRRKRLDYIDNDNIDIEDSNELRNRAFLAVSSTAAIIKLSDFLQMHDSIQIGGNIFNLDAASNLLLLCVADLCQWAALDLTPVALVSATVTAFGGPLSELPFVSAGFWEYIPEAADYIPLAMVQPDGAADALLSSLFGADYRDLTLSSITGPCYFAVCMDAIALGRYFYSVDKVIET